MDGDKLVYQNGDPFKKCTDWKSNPLFWTTYTIESACLRELVLCNVHLREGVLCNVHLRELVLCNVHLREEVLCNVNLREVPLCNVHLRVN